MKPSLRSVVEFVRRPSMTLAVGLGLSGVAGSAFLAIINRSFPKTPAGSSAVLALSGFNFLLATISTGMMVGAEQEMTRAISRALAVGADPAPVIRRHARQAVWLIVVTMVAVCALAPLLVDKWLGQHWYLFFELVLGLVGALTVFPVRGLLTGRQNFPVFSLTLIVEGLSKLLPSLVLLALGIGTVWMFGLLFAVGPGLAALSGVFAPRLLRSGSREGRRTTDLARPEAAERPDRVRGDRSKLALLTAATFAGQLLLNAIPLLVAAKYTGGGGKALQNQASAVNSAVGLTRLGILMLVPLQAPLLPRLSAAAALGHHTEVRRRTLDLAGLCAGVGLAAAGVCWAAGPWVLRTVMAAHAPLPSGYLAALAGGTGFLMVAYILQSTLLALDRHAMVLIAWAAGAIVTVPVFLTGSGLLTATGLAAIVGPCLTVLIMGVDAWISTRDAGGREESAKAVAEAIAAR